LPYNRLSELHEYVHALLAETIHPLFGISLTGTPEQLVGAPKVRGIINEAVDWFVNGWICTKYPVAFRERLARNQTLLDPTTVEFALARDPDPLFGMATFAEMSAELRRFAKWEGQTGNSIVDEMTEEFLETDCSKPSIEALVDLVNSLVPAELDLAVVPICRDGNDPFWLVCRLSDLVPSEQPSGITSSLLAS